MLRYNLFVNKTVLTLLILSTLFVASAFLGGDPSSGRGFYYIVWLTVCAVIVKKQDELSVLLRKSPFGEFATFVGLGLLMIVIEETFAGIAVNMFGVPTFTALLASIPQFYANNLLLLPGFIIAWYILLKRYSYSRKEVLFLVGLFGLFAEKIYLHVLTLPILGIPLILPTMFTYMGIIFPSLLSLQKGGGIKLPIFPRYVIGFLFPILVSLPFLLVHALLTKAGLVDPTVLTK